jgi:hypothetical protein
MIKIKQGDTQVEIGDFEIKGNESLSISIDGRIITFSNLKTGEKREEELEEEEESEDQPEPEPAAGSEPEPKKKKRKYKQYTDDELFTDLLRKSCELVRFPKTVEIDDDNSMASYATYNNNHGNISNIIDKLGHKLKNGKVTEEMIEIRNVFCLEQDIKRSWEALWNKLVEGTQESSGHKPRGISQTKQIMRGER